MMGHRCTVDMSACYFMFTKGVNQTTHLFNKTLVSQRLQRVKHNENDVAGSGGRDDLATSPLAVFGTLDNTGQIQNLTKHE